jgi:tetratricopeptide (TPR) repeat protein
LIAQRDDLVLEEITLLNQLGRYEEAIKKLDAHKFHPWEGGEGKVPEQYVYSRIALSLSNPAHAEEHLTAAFEYPESLGEGKLYGARENRQYYYLGCVFEREGKTEEAEKCFEKASYGNDEPVSAVYYNDQPPETVFYQGLALRRLGKEEEAKARFDSLVDYAQKHVGDKVKIDFFAVSLPDFLVFEDDLCRKNRLHCLFMKALGFYGLGKTSESLKLFEKALETDPCVFQIATHRYLLFDETGK